MKGKSSDNLYCWIMRGLQRKLVLKHLTEEPITAEELRKKINSKLPNGIKPLSLREMSRQLTSFTKQELAECLSPNAPYSRPYRLTKKGVTFKSKFNNY